MTADAKVFTITPSQHVYGGETLGRLPDGRAVFTPFTLPGETIVIRLVEEKRNYCRAVLEEVLAASEERILPLHRRTLQRKLARRPPLR